jgi:PAS domain S-box-containing protein
MPSSTDQAPVPPSDSERELLIELMRLLNSRNNIRGMMSTLCDFMQKRSGCEAVGIRLRDGDDFPYYEHRGFPPEFIQVENRLCTTDLNGQLQRDDIGNPVLECMCGNIICGRFDPSKPFFTPRGSFWSNCTTELLASTTEADRQARTRNRCNAEGYESVALVPLRVGGTPFGLLQFNDHRKGRFTPEFIASMERLADGVALTLAHRKAEDGLAENLAAMKRLHQLGMLSVCVESLPTVLAEVIDAAIALSHADFGNVQLVDAESGDLRIVAHRGFPEWWVEFWNRVTKGKGACGTAMERRERVIVEDVEQSPIFIGNPALEIQRRAGVRAVQSTPLIGRSGKVIGMFSTHYRSVHRPDEGELRLLDLLALQSADIIERKQMEEATHASESRFRRLFAYSPDAILISNREGQVAAANPCACRMLGYSPEEILRVPIANLVVSCAVRPMQEFGGSRKYYYRRKDGSTFPVEISVATVLWQDRECEMALIRDITKREEAESQLMAYQEQLKQLASELSLAEEQERRRLASFLHDRIGQMLVAAKLKVMGLKENTRSTRLKRDLKETVRYLEEVIADTRSLTGQLTPPALYELGLEAAIERMAAEMHRLLGLKVAVAFKPGLSPLDNSLRGVLFQAVREVLTNVAKHGRTLRAKVSIRQQDDRVVIVVEDSGAGFDAARILSDPGARRGFGIFNIRERLRHLGGDVTIDSEVGKGTRVTLLAPLK